MIPRRRSALLVLPLLVACGKPTAPPASAPRAMPADSAAMLASALPFVRPAFATQAEALASAAYHAPAPQLAATVTPAPSPPAAPPPSRTPTLPQAPAPPPATLPEEAPLASFVIQLGAFRERQSADALIFRLQQRFPYWAVIVEEHADVIRIALGEWNSAPSAEEALGLIRSEYPDAWIRNRRLP